MSKNPDGSISFDSCPKCSKPRRICECQSELRPTMTDKPPLIDTSAESLMTKQDIDTSPEAVKRRINFLRYPQGKCETADVLEALLGEKQALRKVAEAVEKFDEWVSATHDTLGAVQTATLRAAFEETSRVLLVVKAMSHSESPHRDKEDSDETD